MGLLVCVVLQVVVYGFEDLKRRRMLSYFHVQQKHTSMRIFIVLGRVTLG